MSKEKIKIGFITTGLLLGLILASIDQTIVSTAMPTVVNELGGFSQYSWVFSIYMLTSTITMPIYGKMADLFGRRKIYMLSLLVFLMGSALCGLAGSMTELIIYRAIQGLGAGGLMPIAFTIAGDIYHPHKIGKFQGLFGAVFAISSILGPTLGGFIVEHGNWSWIFFLNLPVGIPALAMIAAVLKENKSEEKRSIDVIGAISLCGAIASILLGLVLGGSDQGGGTYYPWNSWQIIGLFGLGAALLALFIWIEMKVKDPILPLHLFQIRAIAFGNIAGFCVSAGMFGAIVYIPLFVQGVIGVSPSIAGYILTPMMLSIVVTTAIGGRLMSKISYRAILIPSLTLMMIGFILLSQMTVHTTQLQMIIYMIITGLGMGAIFPAIGTAIMRAVDHRQRGVATSSFHFFRSIGGTLGVSVLGGIMIQRMAAGVQELSSTLTKFSEEQIPELTNPQILLNDAARTALSPEVLTALLSTFTHALNEVFFIGLIFVCISLISSILIGNARLVERD